MANLKSTRHHFLRISQFLFLMQTHVLCSQYKVGELDSWGIPSAANPLVYEKWAKYHNFRIGDSLMFLYPPSQDSVIQVTQESYNSCNLKDPILYMNNGNSLFNITQEGVFYFTSGEPGHCQKKQKLRISVGNGTAAAAADSPSYGPGASAPSYPTNFGSIPLPETSSSSRRFGFSVDFSVFVALVVSLIVGRV